MTHVPALDGLRTIACGLVIAHHVNVPGLSAGYVGVDVFFVLSGYLITSNLLAERARTGQIHVPRFWWRRAVRLWPALIVATVLALVLPSGTNAGDAAAALTYTTNFVQWLTATRDGGLAHAWSLAIEEQFYLAWPLALLVLRGRSRRALAIGTAVIAGASLAVMVAAAGLTEGMSWPVYVLPITRGWELLAGCLVAIAATRLDQMRSAPWATLAAALGVAALVGGGAFRSPAASILAVTATVAVLLDIRGGGTVARVLAVRPLPEVGLVTYGAYLLHVPIYAALEDTGWHPIPVGIATVAATLAAAAASYRWVEVPAREKLTRSRILTLPTEGQIPPAPPHQTVPLGREASQRTT